MITKEKVGQEIARQTINTTGHTMENRTIVRSPTTVTETGPTDVKILTTATATDPMAVTTITTARDLTTVTNRTTVTDPVKSRTIATNHVRSRTTAIGLTTENGPTTVTGLKNKIPETDPQTANQKLRKKLNFKDLETGQIRQDQMLEGISAEVQQER